MNGGGNLPVGPGIRGFIAFFVLAVALWFLVRNMNSRLRRMAYRDRDRAEEFAATPRSTARRRGDASRRRPRPADAVPRRATAGERRGPPRPATPTARRGPRP